MVDQNRASLSHRLFLGVPLTKGLKVNLSESPAWKKSSSEIPPPLLEIHHGSSEYLGLYIEKNSVGLDEIKIKGGEIIGEIEQYCPRLIPSSLRLTLLSQTFIN